MVPFIGKVQERQIDRVRKRISDRPGRGGWGRGGYREMGLLFRVTKMF